MNRLFSAISIFLLACGFSFAQTQTVGVFLNDEQAYEGYVLLSPNKSTSSYLINNCGEVVNEWTSEYTPGMISYLLEDGSLMRTCQVVSESETNTFANGGFGGRLEKFNWEGEMVWSMPWATDSTHHHHDIEILPNGNILIVAWESHSYEEALSLGKLPNETGNPVWSLNISEIEPTGTVGGDVVWSWTAWDHLVQDAGPEYPNYHEISDKPRKININFTSGQGPTNGAGASDWIHCNAIDYNEELDQIIISAHKFSEFWIIDHGITTEEASTELGDLLYRYGNPETYGRGTAENRTLYHQHDTHWITEGDDTGKIMLFNNGMNRPDGAYSTVEIIDIPEFNGSTYPIEDGVPFAPENYSWKYPAEPDTSFYSQFISGASRLPNGNTFICEGVEGRLFEITPEEEVVWDFICPVTAFGPTTQGEAPGNNGVFRAYKYGIDYPAFDGRDLTPTGVIELDSWVTGCEIGVQETLATTFNSYPNPFVESISVQISSDGRLEVYALSGELLESLACMKNQTIQLGQSFEKGAYIVKYIDSNNLVSSKLIIKQ